MSILSRLIEERTGLVRPDDLRVTVTCVPTGDQEQGNFSMRSEYVLTCGVRMSFWANKAQYTWARKAAERALLHRLYDDTLALVDEATKAIFDGEPTAALVALGKLRDDLTKP